MQYTEIFKVLKNEKFQQKMFNIFLKFAQNTDCGYPLEPPRQGGSNEYPQYMSLSMGKGTSSSQNSKFRFLHKTVVKYHKINF